MGNIGPAAIEVEMRTEWVWQGANLTDRGGADVCFSPSTATELMKAIEAGHVIITPDNYLKLTICSTYREPRSNVFCTC